MSKRDRAVHTVLFVGGPKHGDTELIPGHIASFWRYYDGKPGKLTQYELRKASMRVMGQWREINVYAITDASPELLIDAIEKATRRDAIETAMGRNGRTPEGKSSGLWIPGDD